VLGYLVIAALSLPLFVLAFVSKKKLAFYVLMTSGIPITTFMPDFTFLGGIGGLAPQAAYLFFIVFVLVLRLAISAWSYSYAIPRTVLFVIFLLYAMASLFWAPDFTFGFRFLVKLMAPLLILFFVTAVVDDLTDARKLSVATLIAVGIVVGLAVANYVLGGAIGGAKVRDKWLGSDVLTAPYMSPANFSFFLSVPVIGLLAHLLFTKRVIFACLLSVPCVAIGLAFTRIAMLATVVGAALTFFLSTKNMLLRWSIPIGLVMAFTVSLFTVDALKERMFFEPQSVDYLDTFTSFDSFKRSVNTSGRLELWTSVSTDMGNDAAFFGHGIGATDTLLAYEYGGLRLHSELLRIYLDLGLLGLALYIFGYCQLLGVLLVQQRATHDNQIWPTIAIGSLSVYGITLLTDNTLNYVTEFGVYVFATAGIAFGLRKQTFTNRTVV